jgi:hypothetical protein
LTAPEPDPPSAHLHLAAWLYPSSVKDTDENL